MHWPGASSCTVAVCRGGAPGGAPTGAAASALQCWPGGFSCVAAGPSAAAASPAQPVRWPGGLHCAAAGRHAGQLEAVANAAGGGFPGRGSRLTARSTAGMLPLGRSAGLVCNNFARQLCTEAIPCSALHMSSIFRDLLTAVRCSPMWPKCTRAGCKGPAGRGRPSALCNTLPSLGAASLPAPQKIDPLLYGHSEGPAPGRPVRAVGWAAPSEPCTPSVSPHAHRARKLPRLFWLLQPLGRGQRYPG